jgi:predicted  nucleic acid-binding Zn-ribbon protein
MNQSFHLYQLQKLDSQLDQTDQRLLAIQSQLESDERLKEARQVVADRLAELGKVQKKLKKLEQDASAKHIKVEQSESNLYSGRIKNPKELQDVQAEVASIKRAITTLEDQQLELMLEVETVQADVKQSEDEFKSVEAVVLEDQASLNGERKQLQSKRERMLKEKDASLQQVEPAWLKQYQELRRKKRGIAVSAVIDSACSACGTTLTPGECQAARSPVNIMLCPTCGRILYAG